MLKRIPPSEVEPGMYITGFGGRWFDHPFWKRRFKVESATDLERIRGCNVPWVEIDPLAQIPGIGAVQQLVDSGFTDQDIAVVAP
jgi:hypothetical protein